MTDPPLRILHVEDDANDRELAAATLRADGLSCVITAVDSRAAFESALMAEAFDLILADYSLPQFDGLTAQAIARRLCPATPFIFLSATLGEELAVDRLKDGATDYVLKQRIARLPSAVRRARRETAERLEREHAEETIRRLHAELEARVAYSDQLVEAILDHSPMGITVKDVDGRYLLVSRRAEQFIGRSRAELIGKTPADVLPPRLAEIYRTHDRDVMQRKRPVQNEETFIRADGLGVLLADRFPLLDAAGNVYAVGCISADVTERKKSDDEVRLARLEAQRANLAKSEFLSRMSHDLRTPLNAILGFAQLLDLEDLGADRAENVQQILNGGRHLLDLINEVLDITRIETGHLSLSLEPVAVHDVLDRTVSLVKPLAAARGITLHIEPLPAGGAAVLADRQRLAQILVNLLSNAVKYNRADGRITITFEPEPAGLPGVSRLSITDTGAGIPAEKLKLLCQPFERLGAEKTSVEGTGLGLALSRALAQAMGGRLGVDSIVDQGSTFWIELPSAIALQLSPEVAAVAAATPVQAHTGTVLYVEDNFANVRLIERILRRRPGVTLIHAAQGAGLVELVHQRRPDVILLDLHLPDIQGDELLHQLWAHPDCRAIPKVVVTADATPGLVRRLTAAGATACLTKPLEIVQVLQLLDDLLGRR
jgi:PAS domain S-box-containing protein